MKSIFRLIDKQREIAFSQCYHQDNHALLTMRKFFQTTVGTLCNLKINLDYIFNVSQLQLI